MPSWSANRVRPNSPARRASDQSERDDRQARDLQQVGPVSAASTKQSTMAAIRPRSVSVPFVTPQQLRMFVKLAVPGDEYVIVGEDAADVNEPAGQEADKQRQRRENMLVYREPRGNDDRLRCRRRKRMPG